MSNEALLTALRMQTRAQHTRLEQELDLLDSSIDQAGYIDLVKRFYGWYAPLEDRLAAAADWGGSGFDFDSRRKTPLLRKDLAALGVHDHAALRHCEALPAVDDGQAALGCLYVVEGSTLGGQQLSRHFSTHLGLTSENGCAFFASYGSEVGRKWVAFRNYLAREGLTDPAATARAGTAAQETFDSLATWLSATASGTKQEAL